MDKTTSWAIFLAIVAVGYWYYRQNPANRGRTRGRSINRTTNTAPARGDAQWIETESKTKPATKGQKAKAPRKPIKKSVQEVAEKAESYLSGASTTGADADDDLSPAVSPALKANTALKAPSGKDVSDMLESAGNAPSVLKINPSEKPARSNKPQQQKSEAPQETKKQRQNRKKAEEAKQQREADEKARQALLEQQRRTARIARGEPAKNGLQPTKPPAENAWDSGRPASVAAAGAKSNGPLLDTFDPDASSNTSSVGGVTPKSSNLGESHEWAAGLSEEEQLRMALEDSAWETVPKGKKQRKNKAVEESGDDQNVKAAAVPQEAAPAAAAAKKAPVQPTESKAPSSRYGILEQAPDVGHPMDSEWGVV